MISVIAALCLAWDFSVVYLNAHKDLELFLEMCCDCQGVCLCDVGNRHLVLVKPFLIE